MQLIIIIYFYDFFIFIIAIKVKAYALFFLRAYTLLHLGKTPQDHL